MLPRAPACALVVLLSATGCGTDSAEHKAAGNLLFNQGDYAGARAEYERAVAQRPDDPGAHTLVGNALVELGDFAAARAHYVRALRLRPDSPEAHRGMMTVISHTAAPGDDDAFASYLGHAHAIIDARPEDKHALLMAGAVLSETANPADPDAFARTQREAEAILRRGLRIDDRDPRLLFHLALVYARRGDLPIAERVLDRLRHIDTEPGFAAYAAAVAYAVAHDRDRALAAVATLLDVPSVDPASLLATTSYLAPLHDDDRFVALVRAAQAARAR